jgi:peptidoglycan/LPS O-acetylase OafA/YrhL
MSIGAIGAILYFNKNKMFMEISTHITTQIVSWGVILLLACNKFHIASVIDQEIIAVITVFLILNVSTNAKSIINLENTFFNFIGKISYGIYVIHPIIIFYFSKIINNIHMSPDFKYPLIYVGVLLITVFFAFLSYEYLEKYFLKLKANYNNTGL